MYSNSPIILNDALLLASGAHRHTYLHPLDVQKVIKINQPHSDGNEREELEYLSLPNECQVYAPRFFGRIDTNLGSGLVFERICDYGTHTPSKTLLSTIKTNPSFIKKNKESLIENIRDLTIIFQKHHILTCALCVENIIIQRTDVNSFRLLSIDFKRQPPKEFIPLAKYFPFFYSLKAKRKLQRNLSELTEILNTL